MASFGRHSVDVFYHFLIGLFGCSSLPRFNCVVQLLPSYHSTNKYAIKFLGKNLKRKGKRKFYDVGQTF